jgi:hypothetical protein
MRSLAYVETIKSLEPIPGADRIEKATILGWEVVVTKGEFKQGDKAVYAEIDSIFPELPCFEHLRSRKFRIRTIKMKQQISQGIAFPLNILTQIDPTFDISKLKIGDDLTEVLKLVKYDPEALLEVDDEPQVKKTWWQRKVHYWKWKLFGFKPVKKGTFPSDVPRTEEERVQKMGTLLEKCQGEMCYISEKLEGCSSSFIYRKSGNWLSKLIGNNGIFQVCSRNRIIYNSQNGKVKDSHHLMFVAKKYDLHNKMKKLNRNLAIQGETHGGKIQGNVYRLPELDLRVYAMFDIDKQTYLSYFEMKELAQQLEIPLVPIIEEQHILVNDIKYYVELSKGKSKINPLIDREGLVISSLDKRFSFKSISPEYLLKQTL